MLAALEFGEDLYHLGDVDIWTLQDAEIYVAIVAQSSGKSQGIFSCPWKLLLLARSQNCATFPA